MPPRTRTKPNLLPSEIEELRAIAIEAGYVDPYPALGVAPVADIEEDRCEGERCGWTLFVAMDCGVYCINPKCEKYRYDLRQDVPDE
jgi:hypothetical protein